MAKTKRKTDRTNHASAPTPDPPRDSPYLPTADPPRPNRFLLALAVVLFIVWVAVLATISFSR